MRRALSSQIGQTGRSTAPALSLRYGERVTHLVERGRLAGPECEGERSLGEQHGQPAASAQPERDRGAYKRGLRRRVDEVEDDGAGRQRGEQVERQQARVAIAHANGRRVEKDLACAERRAQPWEIVQRESVVAPVLWYW